MSGNGERDAHVTTLTAEVRVLMVGSRQVTLSVYEQLDEVDADSIEPFGRVNPKNALHGWTYVVGRDTQGALVRSALPVDMRRAVDAGRDRYFSRVRDQFASFRAVASSYPGRGDEDDWSEYGDEAAHSARRTNPSPERLLLWREGAVAFAGAARAHWRLHDCREKDCDEKDHFLSRMTECEQEGLRELDAVNSWDELPLIVLAGLR